MYEMQTGETKREWREWWREKVSETESDIDQSGREWDEAVSSVLTPTANQHDRV